MVFSAKDVYVRIGGAQIVKGVSVQVQDKQMVGIIGPNGCGKSTFLKSIYKVLKPQSGTVFLGDMDILRAKEKEAAQKIAVVGQFNELAFDFSVYDMVMLGRAPHKKFMEADNAEDARLVEAALRQVDLYSLRERSYSSLSGGEKQRVILARAIAQQPTLLILDEPTNHLDIKYQMQVLQLVRNMGVSTLAVLHDLQLAAEYCDYLYAMKDGHIVAQGTPDAMLTKEVVWQVYGVRCEIFRNPVTGKQSVAYLN